MNNPVFVPIELETLVVNKNVLNKKGVNTLRWQYSYLQMLSFASPQPDPFSSTNIPFPGTGVMLHWSLPRIVRNGQQNGAAMDFPLTPNRWLIMRYSGPLTARVATAWIMESDSLSNSTSDGGAPFLQPGVTTIQLRWVGKKWNIVDWTEQYPTSETDLFLQAVAPGNPTFATFQPYCNNVFSMFDPLANVADQDTLSYFIAGWYSNPAFDIAGSWETNAGNDPDAFKKFLDRAGWQRAGHSEDTFSVGIYHGMAWGLDWNLEGAAPTNVPDGLSAQVAVGNTTIDALTALLENQAGATQVDVEMLEALQYGLLPKYDQVDPEFELKQQIEQSWLGYRNGGFGWEIVDKPVDPDLDPPPPISPSELLNEETWLATLNLQQQQYDEAVRTLADMQLNLYQVWWKSGFAAANYARQYPAGTSAAQFDAALAPTGSDSLIVQIETQMALIGSLATLIPTGTTQADLQASINAYAAEKNLPASRELKQFALRPFARPNDPVVLIQGMKVDENLAPAAPLLVRFANQLVTQFTFNSSPITAAELSGVISLPPAAQLALLPSQLTALINEFFLLDPDNATMIAAAVLQTTDPVIIEQVKDAMRGGKNIPSDEFAPDLVLKKWTQPWSPLIMLWEITWYPIPYSISGEPLWIFDGNEYQWNGTGFGNNPPTGIPLKGAIFMTPQASFNFKAQLEKFIAENPDNEAAKALEEFIAETDKWDFLSQSFVGFSQSMILRNPLTNVSASLGTSSISGEELSALVGGNATYVPLPGIAQPPYPDSGFQDWRAGQFVFNRLMVVDRFGQTSERVNSSNERTFAPVMSKSLQPQYPVLNFDTYRLVQLPPRLPQPGRLNFDFVSSTNDEIILGDAPGVNPVCAWLLHNLLDESIACYDNTGNALGEVWVVKNTLDNEIVNWRSAPGSEYTTIASLETDFPHLWQMLDALQSAALGANAFRSLINTIDAASWVIDSGDPSADEGLAMLAGRPVAMVRTRLQYELEGNLVTDPSWRYTFAPDTNPLSTWPFNIRLGEGAMRQDGLVGYFTSEDYSVFNAAVTPAVLPDPDYVQPIGTGAGLSLTFDPSSEIFLTLLMDPRAIVHATTGILPVISISIPQPFVTGAFSRMDVFFSVGPVLSDLVTTNDPDVLDVSTVLMPRPAVKKGKWSWEQLELDTSTTALWKSYPVAPTVPTAQFSNVPPVLRTGMLRLEGAFDSAAGEAQEKVKTIYIDK